MSRRVIWMAACGAAAVVVAVSLWLDDTGPDSDAVPTTSAFDVARRADESAAPSMPAPASVTDEPRALETQPQAQPDEAPRAQRVVVVDPEGAGLADVHVALFIVSAQQERVRESFTDDDGVATFELSPGTRGWLAVNWEEARAGYGRHQRESTFGGEDVRIVLPRTDAELHLAVLDDLGVGIGDVRVRLDGPGLLRDGAIVTDERGAVTVTDLQPGAWHVRLDDVPPGHEDPSSGPLPVVLTPAASETVELRVERWGTVVVDVSDLPERDAASSVYVRHDAVRRDHASDATAIVFDLPAGVFTAGVRWPPTSPYATPPVRGTVAPGARIRVALSVIEATVPLSGRVVDELGRVVPDLHVGWGWSDAVDGLRLVRNTTTDEQGRFALVGFPGDAWVSLVDVRRTRCARRVPAQVHVDGPLDDLEFTMPVGRTLHIRLDDHGPRAVDELRLVPVRLDHPDALAEDREFGRSGAAFWRLDRVPAGTHELSAEFEDGETVAAGTVLLGLTGPAHVEQAEGGPSVEVEVIDP